MVTTKKRVSTLVHYCEHGKWVGFEWSGHRRACKSDILTKQQYGELRGRQREAATADNGGDEKTRPSASRMDKMMREGNGNGARNGRPRTGDVKMDKAISTINKKLNTLNKQIEVEQEELDEIQKSLKKKTQLRDNILEGLQ